jgi:hypothetical protein
VQSRWHGTNHPQPLLIKEGSLTIPLLVQEGLGVVRCQLESPLELEELRERA